MAAPATPSRRAPMAICNRCILYMDENITEPACDVNPPGPFQGKCTRCSGSRHSCVFVEPPLFPQLKIVRGLRADAALVVSTEGASQDDIDESQEALTRAKDVLVQQLRTFNKNRRFTTGDRTARRTTRAAQSHSQAASGDASMLSELQTIRRGILALVEVGKGILRNNGASPRSLRAVDRALGPDVPASPTSTAGSSPEPIDFHGGEGSGSPTQRAVRRAREAAAGSGNDADSSSHGEQAGGDDEEENVDGGEGMEE